MFFDRHDNGIFSGLGNPDGLSGISFGAYEGFGDLTAAQNCGDVKLMQKMLNDLGFDVGSVDGAIGNQTLKGLAAFASAHGVAYTPGSFPKGAICEAIQAAWTEAQTPSAPPPGPSTQPAPQQGKTLAQQVSSQFALRPFATTSGGAPIVANGGAGSGPLAWWNGQSAMVKVGVVGGALLALGLVAMAVKKAVASNRYRPNRARPSRRRSTRSACAMKGVKTCRCKPPKGYPKRRSVYALPECWMYPLDTKKRVRTAAARFGKHKRRYPVGVQRRIAKKLTAAKRRFRIAEYR